MDRPSERRDYRNRDDNCENFKSRKSTSSAAPVEIVVHRQHLPRLESTQLRVAGSARVRSPRLTSYRLHLAGTKAPLGPPLCCRVSGARASAANIYMPPPPTMISPHPHTLVAIIIIRIVVRVGVRHAYPKKGEVPEVVTMVEASTRDSAEPSSAVLGSN